MGSKMWFSSRYSPTSDLTSLNLAQHLDLEQSSKASSESTSSTSSTASTESSGTSNMATRSGKNTGIKPSGRKPAAIKVTRGTNKGVTGNKTNIEAAVRKSSTRMKNKTPPPDDDDDESELVGGYASENEIQNTVTQHSDNEDNPDDDDEEESSIGNVPHYCSLMKIIELTLLIVYVHHRIANFD